MKTDEEILNKIYLAHQLKKYDKIKTAFENKDFDYLRTHGHPYIKTTNKEIVLLATDIDNVIKELIEVKEKRQDNEALMTVCSDLDEDDEPIILVTSKLFEMEPVTLCERMAKVGISHVMWKLKHQTNGNDAKRVREMIDKYKYDHNIRLTDED